VLAEISGHRECIVRSAGQLMGSCGVLGVSNPGAMGGSTKSGVEGTVSPIIASSVVHSPRWLALE
jgi:hypothetical protein